MKLTGRVSDPWLPVAGSLVFRDPPGAMNDAEADVPTMMGVAVTATVC